MFNKLNNLERNIIYLKDFIYLLLLISIAIITLVIIERLRIKNGKKKLDFARVVWETKDVFIIYFIFIFCYKVLLYILPIFINKLSIYYLIRESTGLLWILIIAFYFYYKSQLKLNISIISSNFQNNFIFGVKFGILYGLFFPLNAIISPNITISNNVFLLANSPWSVIRLFLMTCLFAPLGEELYFRGIFYPFAKNKVGVKFAILISALFFALIHGLNAGFIHRFIMGVIIAWIFEKTGSILAPFIFHGYTNLIILILSIYNGYIYHRITSFHYLIFILFTIGIFITLQIYFPIKDKERKI